MYPDNVVLGYRKKTVGIGLSKICLGQERKLVKIVNGLDVVRCNSLFLHLFAVIWDIVPDVLNLFHELF